MLALEKLARFWTVGLIHAVVRSVRKRKRMKARYGWVLAILACLFGALQYVVGSLATPAVPDGVAGLSLVPDPNQVKLMAEWWGPDQKSLVWKILALDLGFLACYGLLLWHLCCRWRSQIRPARFIHPSLASRLRSWLKVAACLSLLGAFFDLVEDALLALEFGVPGCYFLAPFTFCIALAKFTAVGVAIATIAIAFAASEESSEIGRVAATIRCSLLAAILVPLLLIGVDQGPEILRVAAESGKRRELFLILVGILAFGHTAHYCARLLVYRFLPEHNLKNAGDGCRAREVQPETQVIGGYASVVRTRSGKWALRELPRYCATIPTLLAALSSHLAFRETTDPAARMLLRFTIALLLTAAVQLVFLHFRQKLFERVKRLDIQPY